MLPKLGIKSLKENFLPESIQILKNDFGEASINNFRYLRCNDPEVEKLTREMKQIL